MGINRATFPTIESSRPFLPEVFRKKNATNKVFHWFNQPKRVESIYNSLPPFELTPQCGDVDYSRCTLSQGLAEFRAIERMDPKYCVRGEKNKDKQKNYQLFFWWSCPFKQVYELLMSVFLYIIDLFCISLHGEKVVHAGQNKNDLIQ